VDADSQIVQNPPDTYAATEGANVTYTSEPACDIAGNCATGAFELSIDITPPDVNWSQSPPANANGWNNTPVAVESTCSDALSGVAYCAAGGTVVLYVDDQSLYYFALDVAGNPRSVTAGPFRIDMAPPSIHAVSGTSGGESYSQDDLSAGILTNDSTLVLSGTAADALSGLDALEIDGEPVPVISGAWSTTLTLSPGANQIVIEAADRADNSSSLALAVAYAAPATVTKQNRIIDGPQGKGFWVNAVANGDYTASEIDAFLAAINVGSGVYGPSDPWDVVSSDGYRAILRDVSSTEAKFRGQLLATWFNLVAGRLSVSQAIDMKTVAGWQTVVTNTGGSPKTTAGNAVAEMEARRLADQSSTYGVARLIAEGLNAQKLESY
jgi:hypothetical protein